MSGKVLPLEEPGRSGRVEEVAPEGARVYYGGREYRTWYKRVTLVLPTGETVTYQYWYNPEAREWVLGHRVSGTAGVSPPRSLQVTAEEEKAFGEAWKAHYEAQEARIRAESATAVAQAELKRLAAQLGVSADTSPGVLQVQVVQAALERAGLSPAEAYQTALKFQYSDPQEVLEFLRGARVDFAGRQYSLFEWALKGDTIQQQVERYSRQLERGLLQEPPKLEELAREYEKAWRVGTPASTTFLESFAAGFTRQVTLGLAEVGGEAQRKVAAGLHRFMDIFASKAPDLSAATRVLDPLGVQKLTAAMFGVDYDKLTRAAAGIITTAQGKAQLKLEEKAELAGITSAIAPHAPAYVFGTGLGTGAAAALQTYALQKAAELPGGKVKLGETTLKFENLAERVKFEAKVHLPERLSQKIGDILVKTPEGWARLGEKPLAPGSYEARVGRLVPHAPTQLDVFAQRVKVPEGEAARLYVGYEGWKPLPRDVNLDLLKLKPGEIGYIPTKEGIRVPITEGKWGTFGARLEGEAFRAQWIFGVGSESGSALKWGALEKPLRIAAPKIETTAVRLSVDIEKALKAAKIGGGLPARPVLALEGAGAVPLALRPTLPVKLAPEPALKPQLFAPPTQPAIRIPEVSLPWAGRREEGQPLLQPRVSLPEPSWKPLEVKLPSAEKPIFREWSGTTYVAPPATAAAPKPFTTAVVAPRVSASEVPRVAELPRLAQAPRVTQVPALKVPARTVPTAPAPRLPPVRLPSTILQQPQLPRLLRRWGKWWRVRWF